MRYEKQPFTNLLFGPKKSRRASLSDDLFDLVLAVAGGAKTRAEAGGFRDLAIFKTGVTL